MKQRFVFLGLMLVGLVALLGRGQTPAVAAVDSIRNTNLTYTYFDPAGEVGRFVPPPANLNRAPATANITANYMGAWTPEAQTAFEYAISIWEATLTSNVTIVVNAEFSALGEGILGGAGPWDFRRNFAGAPQGNTWYPIALANALANTDLNGAEPEIDSAFSNTFDWYYGTDGNPPNNKIDFVSVVLHELGHGLGFVGLANYAGGNGSLQPSGSPAIYSRFTQNGSGTPLLSFPDGSAALGSQLTSNNIYFSGPNANAANGGRVPLYAPASWQQGSSYSHLAESFNGSPNALMTYSIGFGEAEHAPGPVMIGMFKDMGWNASAPVNQPPVFALPNQILLQGTTKDNALDLWVYATDETADNELVFTLINAGNASAGVTKDVDDYIDINPNPAYLGRTTVTVRVQDAEGLTTDASFDVIVVDQLFSLNLPFVTRP